LLKLKTLYEGRAQPYLVRVVDLIGIGEDALVYTGALR